jgi:mannose/cellobiose epimerase-like protein (N-acyl-D-glucosamine 2-epimerase family)
MQRIDSGEHHAWLAAEESRLVAFFEAHAVDPQGGFFWLDERGKPVPSLNRPLWLAARIVHCFSIEHLLGRPGAGRIAEHGVEGILGIFADRTFGGFYSSISADGQPRDRRKEAYGHAFALLASTSAVLAGVRGSAELQRLANAALDQHFWSDEDGAAIDSFDESFGRSENYRGQNSNMHLLEAYLAAQEAAGTAGATPYLDRAIRIADRLINVEARAAGWRVPEHFDAAWAVDREYNIDEPAHPFRPYGTLVGHSLEWSRLLLQLGAHAPHLDWIQHAAEQLFDVAVADGWDSEVGGFVYSVDPSGRPVNTARMHWTIAEAIGAAVSLRRATANERYEDWYDTFWNYARGHVLDLDGGSWWHELSADGTPASCTWQGKPDLYHAWQATLYARLPSTLGIGAAVARRLSLTNSGKHEVNEGGSA